MNEVDSRSTENKNERAKEIERQLSAPLIPSWVHLTIIVMALISTYLTGNLVAILVGVPIWLMFDEILETRSKARMRAFYASIQARSAKEEV